MREEGTSPASARRSAIGSAGRDTEEQNLENIRSELLKTEMSVKTKAASAKPGARKKKTALPENQPDDRTIEELFTELDGIIGKLEDGEISLEDSFHYYEAGMKLVQSCSGKIDKVEKQIQVLNESAVEE